MGSAHARVYSKLKDCELVGICDTDSDKKPLAKMYNCEFFEDSKEFLKQSLDAVSVCTPTSMHRATVENALDAILLYFQKKWKHFLFDRITIPTTGIDGVGSDKVHQHVLMNQRQTHGINRNGSGDSIYVIIKIV